MHNFPESVLAPEPSYILKESGFIQPTKYQLGQFYYDIKYNQVFYTEDFHNQLGQVPEHRNIVYMPNVDDLIKAINDSHLFIRKYHDRWGVSLVGDGGAGYAEHVNLVNALYELWILKYHNI